MDVRKALELLRGGVLNEIIIDLRVARAWH